MITLATAADLPQILAIYAHARAFMAQHGNPNQWGASRPTEADITAHIAARELYVLREADAIHGVFAFILGEDPTYRVIEQGAWLSDAPYGTIHAVASDGQIHGLLSQSLPTASRQQNTCASTPTTTTRSCSTSF